MKISHLIMTASFAGLLMFVTPAHAADAAPAAKAATGEAWTDADVKRLCTNRFPNKPKRYATCLTNNKGHIGKAKSADDAKMIETGVNPKRKAGKMSKAPAAGAAKK